MASIGSALKFLGKMTTNDSAFEVDNTIESLTNNKKELAGLEAGSKAADNTAELTVDDNSRTFGPDIDEKTPEINEGSTPKIKPGKNGSSGKGKGRGVKDLKPLDVTVELNTDVKPAEERKQGGKTRDKLRN